MFNGIIKHIAKPVLKHLETAAAGRRLRREYNRTKRWMRDRANGRLIVSLYSNGMIRRRV